MKKIYKISSLLAGIILMTTPLFAAQQLMMADFERWPNNLNGEIGVYGGGEPDWERPDQSWFYDPNTPGYHPKNVKSGVKSFRLVNSMNPNSAIWATFSIDLGPTIDVKKVPKKIKSLDVSGYKYLTFWIRGQKGGEHFRVAFRDAKAKNYQDESTYTPMPKGALKEWTFVKVPIGKMNPRLKLSELDMVGIHFGKNIGNAKGSTLFVDDFVFTKE